MNRQLPRLSQRYLTALRKHLRPGAGANLRPALGLGRRAVVLGLETLDLARIHEQAMASLGLSNAKNGLSKLAGIFFAEANTLIEQTHLTARQTQARLGKVLNTLGRRTEELAVRNRQLQRGTARRKAMEDDHAKRGQRHQKSLEESLELQKRLRQLTHQVIESQENERKKISGELQNEIAQTLLAINVRLLSLKHEARTSSKGFKNEIASTQRLVVKSAKSVRQFARELGVYHPA